MKVLAINSSPLMGKGNTAVILDPFLEGMREAGAEVELLYTKKLDIKPCQGDFICWTKTPGECHQKDDMEWVRPRMAEAALRRRHDRPHEEPDRPHHPDGPTVLRAA